MRLERAIAEGADKYDVTVSWLPFFLRPNMPKEGTPKGGTPASRVGASLQKINLEEGPEIKFTGICDRYPNTENYHVAMAYVLHFYGADAQTRCVSRIFKGYFQDGIYPDENNLISQIGEVISNLDAKALRADLRSEHTHALIWGKYRKATNDYKVTGVPYFIINDKITFSGAQETENILRAFEQA